MKFIFYILSVSFLLATSSCDGKLVSRFSETKENTEQIQSVTDITESKEIKLTNDTLSINNLSQRELFENLVNTMVINDMDSYSTLIKHFQNMDTLMFYTPSGDEDEIYYSLLGLSCRLNNLEVMKDLVAKGADIKLGSMDEYTSQDALYHAVVGGNAEMVKILIDKGTDVNVIYSEAGLTPLSLCSRFKKYLMAEQLLKAGAKVNGAGDLGFDYITYPLHDAILSNDVEMVKLLLRYNADISLKDKEGYDAITLAQNSESKEILLELEKVKSKSTKEK